MNYTKEEYQWLKSNTLALGNETRTYEEYLDQESTPMFLRDE